MRPLSKKVIAIAAALVALAVSGTIAVGVASAAPPGPAWSIASTARPTIFASGSIECASAVGNVCNSYTLFATNSGSTPTDGSTITVSDTLPTGVTVTDITGVDWARNIVEELECTTTPLQCVSSQPIAPDDTLEITIKVEVTGATGTVTNKASVQGGGAPTATTSEQTPIGNALAPFGMQAFEFNTSAPDGSIDTQAGDHPYEQTTSLELTTVTSTERYRSFRQPKNIVVDLPPGFVGDPQATPRCPLIQLEQASEDFNFESPTFGQLISACPKGSRMGVVGFASRATGYSGSLRAFGQATSVFNLVPEGGHPAEFGFRYLNRVIVLYADLVHTSKGYRLRVTVPGLPLLHVYFAKLTIFGQPGAHNNEPSATASFLTNPTQCTNQPLMTKLQANSWEDPGQWISAETVAYPHIDGCDQLRFEPEIKVTPETTQTDTPSGYEVDLKIPRPSTPQGVLVSPELKDATVTLPAGVSISPSAADGLQGCAPDQIEIPHGMPDPDEAGPGEAIGPNGLSYLTAGHCPDASQIGDVEIDTPLLADPLKGHAYLAQPGCGGAGQSPCTQASATNGELYGLYLEAQGSGVVIKLKGNVSANPTTGQLTTTFSDNPQLPFNELKLRLNNGSRAPLANPQSCGSFTTTTDLTPYSAPVTPDATPSSSFVVGGCANPTPFAPAFSAGTLAANAGAFSPFTLTFSRQDAEQNLAGISVTTPPGLVGMLSQVPLCPEPQASAGSCDGASRIGTATVAAGAGSHPFWVSGRVYLTGPYNGAPFGLTIVVPAKAGPFDLGDVIERAAITINPTTSAITVTSGPLTQIIDGVPLRIKTVNVTIDRPGFMLNPTNCTQQSVSATIASTQGAKANVASPFAVAGCSGLGFKPSFAVTTRAKTSKANGASLDVKVATPAGNANIKAVKVDLPFQLPSRLTTLQKACLAAVFDANPANCPQASIVGIAKAKTPVLPVTLTGPAYLVSHGNEAFPNLVVILQGQGIRVDLTGLTSIKKGITSSNFPSVPDVPVSSFELFLPQGPFSVLAANGNLCKPTKTVTRKKRITRRVNGHLRHLKRTVTQTVAQTLAMPTKITGQNGVVVNQTTQIKVIGCPKAKQASKAKKAKAKAKGQKATSDTHATKPRSSR